MSFNKLPDDVLFLFLKLAAETSDAESLFALARASRIVFTSFKSHENLLLTTLLHSVAGDYSEQALKTARVSSVKEPVEPVTPTITPSLLYKAFETHNLVLRFAHLIFTLRRANARLFNLQLVVTPKWLGSFGMGCRFSDISVDYLISIIYIYATDGISNRPEPRPPPASGYLRGSYLIFRVFLTQLITGLVLRSHRGMVRRHSATKYVLNRMCTREHWRDVATMVGARAGWVERMNTAWDASCSANDIKFVNEAWKDWETWMEEGSKESVCLILGLDVERVDDRCFLPEFGYFYDDYRFEVSLER